MILGISTATFTLVHVLLSLVGLGAAFLRVEGLHALAPTQAEPPFAVAQGLVLVLFVVLGVRAAKGFRAPR